MTPVLRKFFLAALVVATILIFRTKLVAEITALADTKSAAVAPASTPAPAGAKSGLPEASFLKRSSESFRAVAKLVGPAVVVIKSTIAPQQPRQMPGMRGRRRGAPSQPDEEGGGGMEPNDPFYEFFRHFGAPGGPFSQPSPQEPQSSLGSGIIIDKSGIIVTNNHVVEGASKVIVNLPNDERTDIVAKVLGTDPRSDLAVLKIDTKKDLPVAEWGDSDSTEVGDWAIAIGSPFMLTHTVTVGIISAKGRSASSVMGSSDYGYDMLQTDAAINPGNSGGPLCSIDGKVVGVNMAIFTRSGGYMGIGFAIPSNVAKSIVATLAKGQKVVRGWLGVTIQPVDEAMAKDLGISTEGALVHQVQPDSPAEKAGLKPGDVITEVAGKAIKEVAQLQRIIAGFKPGEKVRIKVINYEDKKSRTVDVKIGELPANLPGQEEKEEAAPNNGAPDKLGLAVTGVKEGVRVDAIQSGSLADMIGLEKGDIITNVNRERIKSVAQYLKIIKDAKRYNLVVRRNGRDMFFQVTPP